MSTITIEGAEAPDLVAEEVAEDITIAAVEIAQIASDTEITVTAIQTEASLEHHRLEVEQQNNTLRERNSWLESQLATMETDLGSLSLSLAEMTIRAETAEAALLLSSTIRSPLEDVAVVVPEATEITVDQTPAVAEPVSEPRKARYKLL